MNPQYLTSQTLSQKLKAAGCPQVSLFYHNTKLKKVAWSGDIQLAPIEFGDRYVSAYLASELLELLPNYWEIGQWFWQDGGGKPGFKISWHKAHNKSWKVWTANTLPEAMGECLLYLAEQGIVKFTNN